MFKCSSEKNIIDWLFLLYERTETIVELPNNYQNLPTFEMIKCEMFRNDLQIFSKFEHQFNFVASPNRQIVIYFFNRNVYLASCMTIKEILIPEKIDQCTMDVPFIIGKVNFLVYLVIWSINSIC
jgi:hypothetical protein